MRRLSVGSHRRWARKLARSHPTVTTTSTAHRTEPATGAAPRDLRRPRAQSPVRDRCRCRPATAASASVALTTARMLAWDATDWRPCTPSQAAIEAIPAAAAARPTVPAAATLSPRARRSTASSSARSVGARSAGRSPHGVGAARCCSRTPLPPARRGAFVMAIETRASQTEEGAAEVDRLVDALVREVPPGTTSPASFLGAQFDRGLAWVHFPVGRGGLGLSPSLHQRVVARLRDAGAPSAAVRNVIGYGMVATTLISHGTEAQLDRYLRPLFTGEEIWCQLFSEPGAGSDVASLATRAER